MRASADNWKRKLLDLTKRNRALNFRATKVSTVAIVDEQPAEVFRQLVVRGEAMRFRAAPERIPGGASSEAPGEGAGGVLDGSLAGAAGVPRSGARVEPAAKATPSSTEGAAADEEDEAELLALDFAPYDPAALDGRHTDEWLQTGLTPEALDKSLRRLDEQARLALEEQGVNTLFLAVGMLHYAESPDSEQVLRAPLVLVPVELTRKSARSGYQIRATDDDPIVNPALAEYLRRGFGVSLPELPDANTLGDDYDLQRFLGATATAVGTRPRWAVKTDLVLALFSFQKFVMYKDVEANLDALVAHRLVRQLVTRQGSTGGQVVGLPDEIRHMDLDAEYPPEQTFQVVDADSSQLRAIAAAARQHDLVVEGPPGTGKSQTITNLIAQALAAGKSVLFVAEKMAALSVVHDRLVRAGFGEFCLELHASKANKRTVMQALGTALDASLQGVAAPTASTQRLPVVRAALTDYVRAVHAPHGVVGASPYQGYGEYGRVLHAPRVTYPGSVDGVGRAQLDQTDRDLADLVAAAAPIGVPAEHPWRDTTRTFYTTDDLETVRTLARAAAEQLAAVRAGAARVEAGLSLPPVRTFADVDTAAAIAEVLHRSPGAPLAVLASEAWNAPPLEAARLVEQGRALGTLRDRLLGQLAPEALEQDHEADAAYVERKSQGLLSFLAALDGRYRAIKKRWTGWRQPAFQGSLTDQVALMRQVDRLRAERASLAAAAPAAQTLFGGLWRGEDSDWGVLANYMRWVVEFRGVCVRHRLTEQALAVASRPAPDVSGVAALRAAASEAARTLGTLRGAVGWPADYLGDASLADVEARVTALADAALLGPR